ncbi:hypothetical protein JMJ58_19180 [Haloterrigena salifodinae]|uniref:Uncharacterized protein n=1 Tax=Haloterrigena salifodinae TaxID=2675099 RepID=A0A8T8E0M5_9EURY|nr:DUF6065 family protein [Haloterrigena salifodinae]QRV15006.1 hypothetical protein JMJ58_19180 [Haloterrigena salifodinae]
MIDLNAFTEKVTDLSGYKKLETDEPIIEFVCKKENYGAIPEPIPANRVLPDWYKQLGQYVDGGNERDGIQQSTVKRCAPFMEAMTAGWIIPLAGDVEFHAKDGHVNYNWGFAEELVSAHNMEQVGGMMFPNHEWPVLKWHNYWCVKVPEGYSLLVMAPLNRIEPRFQPFAGIVDADQYFNFINAPFMWTAGEFDGVIEQGTPIVQVIPFRRDAFITDGSVREMTDEEELEMTQTQRRLGSNESMYREERWVHKKGSRNIPASE